MDVTEKILDIYEAIKVLTNFGWEVTATSFEDNSRLRIHVSMDNGKQTIMIDDEVKKDGCDGQED